MIFLCIWQWNIIPIIREYRRADIPGNAEVNQNSTHRFIFSIYILDVMAYLILFVDYIDSTRKQHNYIRWWNLYFMLYQALYIKKYCYRYKMMLDSLFYISDVSKLFFQIYSLLLRLFRVADWLFTSELSCIDLDSQTESQFNLWV